MISQNQRWLDPIPWESVVELNQTLCDAAKVPHELVAQRYEHVRKLWETVAGRELDLPHALDALRQCVQQTPFRYHTLNTFAGVAAKLVAGPARNLPAVEARILSTTVSQYVEGKVKKAELRQVLSHFAQRLQAMSEAPSAPPVSSPAPVRA